MARVRDFLRYDARIELLLGGEKAGWTKTDDIWCIGTADVAHGWLLSPRKCPSKVRFYSVYAHVTGEVHLFSMPGTGHFRASVQGWMPPPMLREGKGDRARRIGTGAATTVQNSFHYLI